MHIYIHCNLKLHKRIGNNPMNTTFCMEKTIVTRRYQFAKMYYDWVIDCLTEDKKWEELAFFRLGVDLMVRQHELTTIEWSQIDYPYVKNIEISKRVKNELQIQREKYYEPKEISIQTYTALNRIWNNECTSKIFNKDPIRYIGSIYESIGAEFRGTYLRSLGVLLKETL